MGRNREQATGRAGNMLASVLSELHNNFGWYTSFHVEAVGTV